MQKNLKGDNRAPMSADAGMKSGGVKAVWHFIKEKLRYPFKSDLGYFLLLWVMMALPSCLLQGSQGNMVYVGYLLMMYYIMAYVVDIVFSLSGKVAVVLKPLVAVLLMFYALCDLYCVRTYGCRLSNDFIQIIAGTNPNEAKEYFEAFVSWGDVGWFVLLMIASAVLGWWLSRKRCWGMNKAWRVFAVVLLLCIVGVWHNASMLETELGNEGRWNFKFEEVIDLRNHLTNPLLEECDSIHPECVVVILGESFSRNHSSLYGYEKCTNPLLGQKRKEGSLLVFRDVVSPCTHTTAAFKYLLNTNQIGHEDNVPWYEHTTLMEVMRVVGYHTVWLSNQAEKGMFDNLPSGHARLCDESFFLQEEYDGGLVGKDVIHQGNKCVFYHLMGQHEVFQSRYPKTFERFKAKDYLAFPEHQRETLAAYDNATLYNDYVVSSIIDLYKNQDAVVFYFSDHALDVFDTDSNYFGHAKMTEASQAHGKEIPFMIYVSPVFQQRHAQVVDRMKSSVDTPFCTDRFIYAVMDVAGYRFTDNDEVEEYSVFLSVL